MQKKTFTLYAEITQNGSFIYVQHLKLSLLERDTEENLYDKGLGKEYLDIIPKP